MTSVVQNILAQIDTLNAAEQEELKAELRVRAYREWEKAVEVERARSVAEGLTEEDINRACAEVRYGKTKS